MTKDYQITFAGKLRRFVSRKLKYRTPPSELLAGDKLAMIDRYQFESFADLGGVWRVDGGYSFYALKLPKVKRGLLVDTHLSRGVVEQAARFRQLEIIEGNFGDLSVAERVNVDAVFLFDVLLHQVKPDWDQILEIYAPRTKAFLVCNPQYTKSDTVRLLDLGKEEYLRNVPHSLADPPYVDLFEKLDELHPDHNRPWRDVHHIWQWGITDSSLIGKMEALGFRQAFYKNCGRFGNLDHFENHAFIFERY